jgi:hypothetical protein
VFFLSSSNLTNFSIFWKLLLLLFSNFYITKLKIKALEKPPTTLGSPTPGTYIPSATPSLILRVPLYLGPSLVRH